MLHSVVFSGNVLVYLRDRSRPFTHRRSHPLYRSITHVACSKYTRNARLEKQGFSLVLWPIRDRLSGNDESMIIALERIRKPLSSRTSPDQDEYAVGRFSPALSSLVVP